jgi:hypothetical protein
MKKLIFLALGLFVLIGVPVLALYVIEREGTPMRLVLTNTTSSAITGGTFAVCDKTYDIKPIAPGQSRGFIHGVRGDCHYTLTAHLANGRILRDEFGYITSGMPTTTRYDVTDSGEALSAQ